MLKGFVIESIGFRGVADGYLFALSIRSL